MTYAEIAQQVRERQQWCRDLARRLRNIGWDVTPEKVNRHYKWFKRWDDGLTSFGYVVNRTGIRRLEGR